MKMSDLLHAPVYDLTYLGENPMLRPYSDNHHFRNWRYFKMLLSRLVHYLTNGMNSYLFDPISEGRDTQAIRDTLKLAKEAVEELVYSLSFMVERPQLAKLMLKEELGNVSDIGYFEAYIEKLIFLLSAYQELKDLRELTLWEEIQYNLQKLFESVNKNTYNLSYGKQREIKLHRVQKVLGQTESGVNQDFVDDFKLNTSPWELWRSPNYYYKYVPPFKYRYFKFDKKNSEYEIVNQTEFLHMMIKPDKIHNWIRLILTLLIWGDSFLLCWEPMPIIWVKIICGDLTLKTYPKLESLLIRVLYSRYRFVYLLVLFFTMKLLYEVGTKNISRTNWTRLIIAFL